MIDDTAFYAWLRADNRRVVLIDMGFRVEEIVPGSPGDDTVPTDSFVHLATQPYNGSGQHYFDCVAQLPSFTRAVDQATLGGAVTISYGDTVLNNQDGRMDFMLDLACDGSSISYSIGDASWDRSDFRLLFAALVRQVSAPTPNTLSITIRDVGLLLNKSVGGRELIGGTGPNAAQTRAFFFGFVHNVPCTLKTFGPLLYDYADTGSVAAVGSPPSTVNEVRDQGIGVVFTDNNDGTLNLSASPAGTITADLYRLVDDALPGARCSQLIDELVANLAGLAAPDKYLGAHPSFEVGGEDDYPVGIYIATQTNLLDVLAQAISTALGFWSVTHDGRFTFGRFRPDDIPSLHLPVRATIKDDDVLAVEGIVLTRLEPTYYAVPAIVNKNWQLQSSFAGALTAEEQALYSRSGLTVDPTTIPPATQSYLLSPQSYHQLLVKAPAQETLISAESDTAVQIHAQRWIQMRVRQLLPWIEFVVVNVGIRFFEIELGDAAVFDLNGKLGFDQHALFQVAGIEVDLDVFQIKLTLVRRRPANVTEVEYDDLT